MSGLAAAQRAYWEAFTQVDGALEAMQYAEHDYIIRHGITNPDGSTPPLISDIEDDEAFEQATSGHTAEIEASGLAGRYQAARGRLKEAGDALVQFALTQLPPDLRAATARRAEKNATTRQRLIDLTLRLDAASVQEDEDEELTR